MAQLPGFHPLDTAVPEIRQAAQQSAMEKRIASLERAGGVTLATKAELAAHKTSSDHDARYPFYRAGDDISGTATVTGAANAWLPVCSLGGESFRDSTDGSYYLFMAKINRNPPYSYRAMSLLSAPSTVNDGSAAPAIIPVSWSAHAMFGVTIDWGFVFYGSYAAPDLAVRSSASFSSVAVKWKLIPLALPFPL